ncbi:MAG TPA: DUF2459 domain-containing protein [Candidatus Binatia bacterium]|jgi:hypothetical protein|nr:DUF2459 domain-containing protein [Candidatus Binatia bacterium]
MLLRVFAQKMIPALSCFLFFLGFTDPAPAHWACGAIESGCKTVFIVHGGWHAAIVLHAADISPAIVPEIADFPQVRFIEFSWGDKDYFPDPGAGPFTAMKAAFSSSGSVLHLVGVTEEVARFYSGAEIIKLQFAATAFGELLSYLSETFARPQPGVRARSRPGLYPDSRFYPGTRRFALWNTCNTWVADALAAGGFPISPSFVVTAGQLSEQISKVKSHAIVFEQRS